MSERPSGGEPFRAHVHIHVHLLKDLYFLIENRFTSS